MLIFPLTRNEELVLRWCKRIVPLLVIGLWVLMAMMSVAAALA